MIQRHWPLFAAITLLWVLLLGVLLVSLGMNDGILVYALDDPYIHMAMAKHWASVGVPGITADGFTSASSSPLWLVLLTAIYAVIGPSEIAPLIINAIVATGALVLADRIVREHVESPHARALTLVAFILFVPMVTIVYCGMEHIAHLLIALGFLYVASQSLAAPRSQGSRRSNDLWLLILAPLLSSVRYEGAMMIGVVALFLLLRRRFIFSVILLVVGALPLVAYGLYSISHGWKFFPNSLLLKGNTLDLTSLGSIKTWLMSGLYEQLIHESHILIMLVVGLVTLAIELRRRGTFWSEVTVMQGITLLTLLLHLQFAGVGWLHRYEAYLVGMWTVAIGITWCRLFPELATWLKQRTSLHTSTATGDPTHINRKSKTENRTTPDSRLQTPDSELRLRGLTCLVTAALIILLIPFIHRGLKILITPRATANIYQQQYQMGLFVKEFYSGRSIMLNDIGAVSFLAESHILDNFGLGSLEPALLRRSGRMTTRASDSLAQLHGTEIAIVYDEWLLRDGEIPKHWIKVGEWEISNNVVCGNEVVSFYALDERYTDELARNLAAFSGRLPGEVGERRYER